MLVRSPLCTNRLGSLRQERTLFVGFAIFPRVCFLRIHIFGVDGRCIPARFKQPLRRPAYAD